MNSSILVTGFVVVGVGTMAFLFNPFGSSPDTSATPTATYQTASDLETSPTPGVGVGLKTKTDLAAKPSAGNEVVSLKTSESEPFVWENKNKTVASKGLLKDLQGNKAPKSFAKKKKSSLGQSSLGGKATKKVDSDLKTVAKKSSADLNEKSFSTVDADLDSFFGSSTPKSQPTARVAKTLNTHTSGSKSRDDFGSVADQSEITSMTSRSKSPKTAQVARTVSKPKEGMFSFALREADDAPMLAPVKSLDFNAPSMELDKKAKVSANQSKNLKDFSGSLEPVITEPAFSATVRDFRIKNPLQTRLPVTFLADGKKVTLNPGQHFTLKQTENVRVKFSRGGSFGFTDDLLSAGNYEFSVTRKEGWKLAN